jgi:hypothetical protein
MAEVLCDLVERAALVEERGRAGMAEVVAAEVWDAGALERGDPDAALPVLPPQVPALAVGEDERAGIGSTAGEIKLDELACDRPEQLRLAAALPSRVV